MNYYEEILTRVKQLVTDQKYDEALEIINEELKMPYVPQEFETKLKDYRQELLAKTLQTKTVSLSVEQIFNLLENEEVEIGEKIGLIQKLETLNLRNYLSKIQSFLNRDYPNEIKTILIYLLANQEIDHLFTYKVLNTQVEVNPKQFDFKTAELVPVQLTDLLEKNLPKDYPQLGEMGKIVIANFYYKLFPLTNNYDLEKMSQAIKNRLLQVNGINEVISNDEQILQYEKLLWEQEII